MSSKTLEGPRAPALKTPVKQLIVLLHGYGADGQDLFPLHRLWQPILPHAVFIAPNAPEPCALNPMGYQWFDLDVANLQTNIENAQRGAPLNGMEELLQGARAASPVLNRFLDDELASYGLPGSQLALIGFSQGAKMALYTGLRRDPGPAAIIGYSGSLPGADRLAAEIKSRPQVLLAHGEADPIVPFAAMEQAASALKAAGVPVKTMAEPGLGHAISEAALTETGHLLAQVFASDHEKA